MSFESKIVQVTELINNHNKSFPIEIPDKGHGPSIIEGYVEVMGFIRKIKLMGATTEDHLKRFSYEEILECLPKSDGVKPVFLAKDIAKIFRGNDDKEESKPISSKSAEKMTPQMLVAHFDPYDPDNAVGKRLSSMSKGEPFVVLTNTNQVNQEVTIELLAEIRKCYEGRAFYTSKDGTVYPVYRVGEVPDNFADENPIFAGRPLRPDGTCDQTGRSWEGVSSSVRQLVRVALMEKEIVATIDKAHDIMDLAIDPAAWKKISQRYTKSTLKYKELEGVGNLPKLKIKLGRSPKSPFDGGKKVGTSRGNFNFQRIDHAEIRSNTGLGLNESYDYGSWYTQNNPITFVNGQWIYWK